MGCAGAVKEEPATTAAPWFTQHNDFGRSSATEEPVKLPLLITWERNTSTDRYTTPAIADGIVYTGSTSGFYAFKLSSGVFVWGLKTGEPVFGTPTVTEDRVYIGTAGGKLYSLDRTSGERIWSYQALSQVSSSPVLSGTTLYFTSSDLRLHALDAATGKRLWSYSRGPYRPVSSRLLNSPALYEDSIITLFPDGYVVALSTDKGTEIWQRRVSKNLIKTGKRRRTPLVSDGLVYLLGDSGSVIALDAGTGKPITSINALDTVDFVVKDDHIYLLSQDGLAATGKDGTVKWTASLGGARGDSLFVAGNMVFALSNFTAKTLDISFLTTDMGRVSAFALDTGEKVWEKDLKETVLLPASASEGTVAIVSTEGTMTVLSLKGIERNLGALEPF